MSSNKVPFLYDSNLFVFLFLQKVRSVEPEEEEEDDDDDDDDEGDLSKYDLGDEVLNR